MGSRRIYEFYNEHAKQCAPDDFWRQVRRSVGGKPVDARQIEMIVRAVREGLDLRAGDVVLDLCCGNGVLSDRIFSVCAGGVGVDFAEYLISVAERHFQRPGTSYVVSDVERFVAQTEDTGRFTKVLCYGSFAYLSQRAAAQVLARLRRRFDGVVRVFVGNLPDKARLVDFRRMRADLADIENDHEAALGLWRTQEEFAELASAADWCATFARMPDGFYAREYRYDAVLSPQ